MTIGKEFSASEAISRPILSLRAKRSNLPAHPVLASVAKQSPAPSRPCERSEAISRPILSLRAKRSNPLACMEIASPPAAARNDILQVVIASEAKQSPTPIGDCFVARLLAMTSTPAVVASEAKHFPLTRSKPSWSGTDSPIQRLGISNFFHR